MSEHSPQPGKTPSQAARSHDAQVRQTEREQRSPEEQLALLDTRPGRAVRERKRLVVTEAPEVQELLSQAAASPTVRRSRRRKQDD